MFYRECELILVPIETHQGMLLFGPGGCPKIVLEIELSPTTARTPEILPNKDASGDQWGKLTDYIPEMYRHNPVCLDKWWEVDRILVETVASSYPPSLEYGQCREAYLGN